jgi:putative selenate reductase
VHGRRAATPFGPAAGPHTQLAQNIVLAWLAGGRVIELKTVQVKDMLVLPRPCIDMATVGYNVEWSQELTLPRSLTEYVKAAMLIEMLKASGKLALAPGFGDTVLDMSVGYDLAGIRSQKVQAFIHGLLDATPIIDRLRGEIPDAYRRFRDLPYPSRLSDTLTLSTFHGCPPEEIEGIAEFLMRANGLNVVVKLNPTLLGRADLHALLYERLNYTELQVPDAAFATDTRWDQAAAFCERLGATGKTLGLGFGVKFCNTLRVRNHRTFFPASETEMYLSGAPLHVLAVALLRRFRRQFGDRLPISFSAGIDAGNFADVAALGLAPITACSDLLKPGGYGRAHDYFRALYARMDEVAATTLDQYVLRAFGHGGEERTAALLANTESYAERALADPRYAQAANATPPRHEARTLGRFDCMSCDHCVQVCPNDANFTYTLPRERVPVTRLTRTATGWVAETTGELTMLRQHQIGNVADVCNECGNCDVFCPEDGAPYLVKPRFFVSFELFREQTWRDGVHIAGNTVFGRFEGRAYELHPGPLVRFVGPGFDVQFDPADPAGTIKGRSTGCVDLTPYVLLDRLGRVAFARQGLRPLETQS